MFSWKSSKELCCVCQDEKKVGKVDFDGESFNQPVCWKCLWPMVEARMKKPRPKARKNESEAVAVSAE
jgi:hypothetical protein